MMSKLRNRVINFLRDESGNAAVEYTIVFLPLIFTILFIFEAGLAYHWIVAAQKGAERGARAAATVIPVVNELTQATGLGVEMISRPLSIGGVEGGACYLGNCQTLPTVGCIGGARLGENAAGGVTCSAARFQAIYNEVANFAHGLSPEDVSVIYEDLDLGNAGEPYVAAVTVAIAERPFPLALGYFDEVLRLPAASATLITGDLVN